MDRDFDTQPSFEPLSKRRKGFPLARPRSSEATASSAPTKS